MDFKKHLGVAWENTLGFIIPVIILTIVQLLVILLSFGILAPVTTAGYIQSLLRAHRDGREPKVGDLFSEMRLFLPLLGFAIIASLAIFFGFLLLVLPGLAVIAFLAFASIYMMPLMTDREMGLFDAIKESWNMAVRNPVVDQIVFVVLYLLIISIGSSLPLVLLFAQPLATFFLVSVYIERLQDEKLSIDQEVPADSSTEDNT